MPKYYPGMYEALEKVDQCTEDECLNHLDALYGRDNLRYGASLEEVREETRRQIREDFRDTSPEAQAQDEWVQAMVSASKKGYLG